MSIEAKIETLKSIAALDAELLTLQAELRAERAELDKKVGRRTELAARAQVLEGSLGEMDKTRGILYGELRQLTLQVDKAREKMARCRNEREANAASREMEELRRIQRERENEIQKLVGLGDEGRADLETVQAQLEELAREIGDNDATLGAKMGDLEARIGEKQTARDALAAPFDKALLRRYDAVRSRRGTGMASVEKGTCTACHIELAPMVYQQMMHRKELFTCPSCLRILYLAPAPESPSVAPPSDSSEG